MTFTEVVKVTIETPGFLAEYDRLFNTTFTRGGIAHAVDVATGKFNDDGGALRRHLARPVRHDLRADLHVRAGASADAHAGEVGRAHV
ncbi:MAG TPA: hypothetical protein PKI27_00980 [Dermatophilaceae bacterium]|nr:hypothetical protein [Dermatophilaceae bacterium]